MAFEDYKSKPSITLVFTGEGKGKTSAGLGTTVRALGTGWQVAFIQFVKYWDVGEHQFLKDAQALYGDRLYFHKGGLGFFEAQGLSAAGVSLDQHQAAAQDTYVQALSAAQSGDYQLLVCDEINNAVHDGLLTVAELKKLIETKHEKTNLCLTGRNYPDELLAIADIVTDMSKVKHHFDDEYIANKGIDY